MENEFSLNENRLAFIENNTSVYKGARILFIGLLSMGLFFIVFLGYKEPWAIFIGVFLLVLSCVAFVDLLNKRARLEEDITVYFLIIDSTGITKPWGSGDRHYYYSWSKIQKIIRADSFYSIAYSKNSERRMEDEEFSATNAFLLVFKEECPLGLAEGYFLQSRTTGKGLNYIYLDVPENQIKAAEDALIKFSPDQVSLYRYNSVSFNCKSKTDNYLS